MHIALTIALWTLAALALASSIAGLAVLIKRMRARPGSYMLRGLTPSQLEALTGSGLPATGDSTSGVEIPLSQIKAALKALGSAAVTSYPLSATQHEMVIEPTEQKPELAKFKVTVHSAVPDRITDRLFKASRNALAQPQNAVSEIIRFRFLPLVKKDIVVHFCKGEEQRPIADEAFHIFIESARDVRKRISPPAELFGIAVGTDSYTWAPSGAGDSFVDTRSNHAFAQLFGDCLYVFYGLDDSRDPKQGLALLCRVLEQAAAQLDIDSLAAAVVNEFKPELSATGTADASQFSVFDQGFQGRRQVLAKSLVKGILGPAIQREILILDCGGKNHEPLSDGMFHVFCDSSPLGTETRPAPDLLWGLRQGKDQHAFLPSGKGLLIADDTGFPVSELFEQNLYIYLDLLPSGSICDARLFARFLKDVCALVAAGNGVVRHESVAAKFELECTRLSCKNRPEPDGTAQAPRSSQLQAASDALSAKIKQVRSIEREFFRLSQTPSLELGAEFDSILKIRKVLDVRVTSGGLTATTDLLYCVDPRTGITHEIGAFEITFPTDASKEILWVNKTRRVKGWRDNKWYGPHIDVNGKACLGTVKDIFPKLLAKREFATAVELAIAFVESVNVNDDAGKYINNWPIAHGRS